MTYLALVADILADCRPDRQQRLDAHYTNLECRRREFRDDTCKECGHSRSVHMDAVYRCLLDVCGCGWFTAPERERL